MHVACEVVMPHGRLTLSKQERVLSAWYLVLRSLSPPSRRGIIDLCHWNVLMKALLIAEPSAHKYGRARKLASLA